MSNTRRSREPRSHGAAQAGGDRRRRQDGSSGHQSAWEQTKIKSLLKQPVGAPISLTKAEAAAIAEEAFGARPDLPPGSAYVRSLKHIWRGLLGQRRGRRSA